uniref:Uncharacterized protein n=1 Tax=Arundo donax TaxID=35708 RepID=A0A0A9HCG8_ARUDO
MKFLLESYKNILSAKFFFGQSFPLSFLNMYSLMDSNT